MEAFTTHTGIGVPLRRSNVDTDQIIPAVYLKRVTRTGFEDGLFAAWRNDPSFVLESGALRQGFGLVAGPDFGTGSSREHAVWALMDYGFRVVISSRFADIFRGNAGKAGLLAAEVAQDDVELLWKLIEQHPGLEITVNLQDRTITAGTVLLPFNIDDYTAWRLLEGLDDIGLTLRKQAEIEAYEAAPAEPGNRALCRPDGGSAAGREGRNRALQAGFRDCAYHRRSGATGLLKSSLARLEIARGSWKSAVCGFTVSTSRSNQDHWLRRFCMNKAELIDVLTEKLGTDRRQATAAVENVVDTIVRAVHKGDSVTITGFGVFEQRRRAARVARNPRTGETVKVKPTSVPAFRPGAQFKAVVVWRTASPGGRPCREAWRQRRHPSQGRVKKAVKKAVVKKAVPRRPR